MIGTRHRPRESQQEFDSPLVSRQKNCHAKPFPYQCAAFVFFFFRTFDEGGFSATEAKSNKQH
jgi:hypothetical protein